jgi:drug/metabolite transporter (DMT)-like permease
MNRIALVGAILAVLLAADGIYMVVSNYNDGETQVFGLLDGWIVVISAAVVLLASSLAFVLSSRSVKTAKPATPQPVARSEVKSEQA